MGDPRPALEMRKGFLGKVMSALSQWMSSRYDWRETGRESSAGDRQGREGSRKRVAKPMLRGEHSTLGCIQDDWGGVGTKDHCEVSAGGWSQKIPGPVGTERISYVIL